MNLTATPIGRLRTPWKSTKECPRNGRRGDTPECTVEVDPQYIPGLKDLEGYTHLILLYWLDQAGTPEMVFTPPNDTEPRGVFATRTPRRPNPIGLSVVKLESIPSPGILKVRYLDCIDGTPLLDIKPYLPSTDAEPEASMGFQKRSQCCRDGLDEGRMMAAITTSITRRRNTNEARRNAESAYPFKCCVVCGLQVAAGLDIAHMDHDPANNASDNLVYLCRTHHWMYDAGMYPAEAIKLLRKHWQNNKDITDHSARMKDAGPKAAKTRKWRAAGRKAAETRKVNLANKKLQDTKSDSPSR